MKKYVKTFGEFINEANSVNFASEKVDELWNLANDDENQFNELMKQHLDDLDVVEFCKYFSDTIVEDLTNDMRDLVYDDTDEDGQYSIGVEDDKLGYYDKEFFDDEQFGEYGIVISYDNNKFSSSAFCGEMDLEGTELGDILEKVFLKSFEIAKNEAEDNWRDVKKAEKELNDLYMTLR